MTEETQQWIVEQPHCTTHRGWCCMPVSVQEFRKALLLVKDTTGIFIDHIPEVPKLHVFTDGTGLAPAIAQARLVAWSWVATGNISSEVFYRGAQGGVPGWWQTVVRAETCAVISAVKYSLLHRQPMIIFCDNGQVVKRFKSLRRGQTVDDLQSDADLWKVLAELLQHVSWEIDCVRVFSHQDMAQLSGIDHWVCSGNQLADSEAAEALRSLPASLLSAQRQAEGDIQKYARCYKDMVDHLVRVGHQSVTHGKSDAEVQSAHDRVAPQCEYPHLDTRQIVRDIRYKVPRVFHTPDLPKWMEWFSGLDNDGMPVKLVSWIELLIHYQATTGRLGMVCKGKGQCREWVSITAAAAIDFGQLYRGFCQFGWNMLRLYAPVWRTIHARPYLYRIQFWTSCIPVRIGSSFERIVDDHFRICQTGMLTSAKDVARLQCATAA